MKVFLFASCIAGTASATACDTTNKFTVKTHKKIREEYIRCKMNANFVPETACFDGAKASFTDCNAVVGDAGIKDPNEIRDNIEAQAGPEIRKVYKELVCGATKPSQDSTNDPTTYITLKDDLSTVGDGKGPGSLTVAGNCATNPRDKACHDCMEFVPDAILRVTGEKTCAATATATTADVARPTRVCNAATQAGADADAAAEVAGGMQDGANTAAMVCWEASKNMANTNPTEIAAQQLALNTCMQGDVRRAIADAGGKRGGHACGTTGGSTPTCTDNANTCVTSVCVCAADKTGLKCDQDLAANIDGGALVGFVQDAAIRGVGTKIKDCIKLALNAVGTAGAEKYAPTQGQLDTCHGLAKAAYKIAKGVVQLSDQEWERTKRDAMHVQVQTFLDSCNKNVETLTTGATAKTAAYKDCHVEKDRIVSFVEGRPFTYPCGPGVTISTVQTFFPNKDGTGKLIKEIQCDATATANEIFNTGADAAADLINVVGDAAGDARSNCMVTVRAAFTTATTNIEKAALAKPCHDAAKAAIATAQGVDLSLISEADVERAIDSGAVKGAATAVTNCMDGVAASITATTDPEKKAAQKACVTGSAKNALIDSLGLVDATELKDSMLNQYVEEAAKGNMIDAVKVCVGAIADADAEKATKQEACRTTTAKEAYMKAKGLDSTDTAAKALISKADLFIALEDATEDEVTASVTECAKLATDKKMCIWTTAKNKITSTKGETIDTTATAGKAELMATVRDAARGSVKKDIIACMKAAKDITVVNDAKTARGVCRVAAAKTSLTRGLAKEDVAVTVEAVAVAVREGAAANVRDKNTACYEALKDLADGTAKTDAKKACFVDAMSAAADGCGKTFDTTEAKTAKSSDKINFLEIEEVRTQGMGQAITDLAQGCKKESEAASCTPEKFAETFRETYGTTSEGVEVIGSTTTGTADEKRANKVKLAKVVKAASVDMIKTALNACVEQDATGAVISAPGTDVAANPVRDCAKAHVEANGFDQLTSAEMVPSRAALDATKKDKRFKRVVRKAVVKMVCEQMRACAKAIASTDTKEAAATAKGVCETRTKTFAKKFLHDATVDEAKWLKHTLLRCRADVRADATKCDPSQKDHCAAVLKPVSGANADKAGEDATEVTNAGGKAREAIMEQDLSAVREGAEAFANCKDITATDATEAEKLKCVVAAKVAFVAAGGNADEAVWNSKHAAKIKELGAAIFDGDETVITTKPSIDMGITLDGVCDAGKITVLSAQIKTACDTESSETCTVKDVEKVEIPAPTGGTAADIKCVYKYVATAATAACTNDASCDALATKMAAATATITGNRRRLGAAEVNAAQTTTECPSTGCTETNSGDTPTASPTVAAPTAAGATSSAAKTSFYALGMLAATAATIAAIF